MLLAACPPSEPAPVPPAPVQQQPTGVAEAEGAPPALEPDGDEAAASADAAAVGEPCLGADECASGICEGMGCGEPGTCQPKQRTCTRDERPYCGCDGTTFRASGSCPGRRFAYRGPCSPERPRGAPCVHAAQCASGICEGMGCGDAETGTCVEESRPCTEDLRPYCGCGGETFRASGSCPGRRFAHRGACDEGAGVDGGDAEPGEGEEGVPGAGANPGAGEREEGGPNAEQGAGDG